MYTGYQRSLLDVMFLGDAAQRTKYTMMVADSIQPKLPAKSYIDRGPHENELKQVLRASVRARCLSVFLSLSLSLSLARSLYMHTNTHTHAGAGRHLHGA